MKIPFILSVLLFSLTLTLARPSYCWPILSDTINADSSALKAISSHPEMFISPLPSMVKENSGIIFFRDRIWTHNDSGGKPEIYGIDTATGKIVQTIKLTGAKNIDWEDIAQDAHHIYIGDFGNNRGNRQDLKIYKIPKQEILAQEDQKIKKYEVISFSYGDQQSFEKRMNRNDFDCEAMVAAGDSLFLFSKNWADQQTKMYVLPTNPGNYTVYPREIFDAGGLITGAGLSPDGSQLALIGYIDYESFMWLFRDYRGTNFFSGRHLRVNFPDMVFVQTEGICFVSDDGLLISCEESADFPSLFSINADSLWTKAENQLGDYFSGNILISGMPPEVSRRLNVDLLKLPDPDFHFELRNRRWEKLDEGFGRKDKHNRKVRISMKTKHLENGLYFLKIESGEHSLIRKVRVKH